MLRCRGEQTVSGLKLNLNSISDFEAFVSWGRNFIPASPSRFRWFKPISVPVVEVLYEVGSALSVEAGVGGATMHLATRNRSPRRACSDGTTAFLFSLSPGL